MNTLPIISLAAFDQPDHAPAEAQKLFDACKECGFFYLQDHGVDPALIQRTMAASRTFFCLPEAVKGRYGHAVQTVYPPASRGFIPMYGEILHKEDGADAKELFDLGFERPASDKPFTGSTVLPNEAVAPDFAYSQLALQEAIMGQVTPKLLHALARALGQDPTYFDPYFVDPTLIQRVIHYPGSYSSAGRHTDTGIFTVLIQEQTVAPSLHVYSQGAWIPAPYIEGTFVINLGDMLQYWTDGLFVSTPHQVTHRAASSRVSMPFFVFPNIDTVFTSLASGKKVSVQEVMLKNFESIWVAGTGSGRAQELN
ncbi:MAG: 2-oxoglutarate and iron-dependent oxygenase domain-containing protein [Caldilineaceae bacterium]